MNEVTSTKDRILDAAERLFGHHGVDATSLRTITAEAEVNLAAVNYHFQSKEVLVQAVLERRLTPMNRERLDRLSALEAEAAPCPVAVSKLIEALIGPALRMKRDAPSFVPLMGRLYAEQRSFVENVFTQYFSEPASRFHAAFHRALPALPAAELTWRLHFVIGAMVHAMAAQNILRVVPGGGLHDLDDVNALTARMVAFFTAAFESPVPEVINAQ